MKKTLQFACFFVAASPALAHGDGPRHLVHTPPDHGLPLLIALTAALLAGLAIHGRP